MAGQYTLNKALRLVPNNLLNEYFNMKGIGTDIRWNDINENEIALLRKGVRAAAPDLQSQLNEDFAAAWAIAEAGGYSQFEEVAKRHECNIDLETVQEMDPLEFSVWMLINHPKAFDESRKLLVVAGLNFDGRNDLPESDAVIDDGTITSLESKLTGYYTKRFGNGRTCKIEPYPQGDSHILYCYLEDFPRAQTVFDERRQLNVTRIRPAFEVVYVYDPKGRALNTHVKGGARARRGVEKVFSETVLGTDIGPPPPKAITYNLEPMKRGGVDLAVAPEDQGLDHVMLRALKLKFRNPPVRSFTIEVGADASKDAVMQLAEQLFSLNGFNREDFVVQYAVMDFVFDVGGRLQSKSVRITVPYSRTMSGDKHDQIVRTCLRRWGIDVSGTISSATGAS